jgi:hypothetical protein
MRKHKGKKENYGKRKREKKQKGRKEDKRDKKKDEGKNLEALAKLYF